MGIAAKILKMLFHAVCLCCNWSEITNICIVMKNTFWKINIQEPQS